MKILIAEDDLINRTMISRILTQYGNCTVTENGLEAVLHFEQALKNKEPFDLVCLDIMMPEMDGLETIRRIREIEKDYRVPCENTTKVIMTTGLDDVNNVYSAFSHGCEAYITKPIDSALLVKELKKIGLVNKELR